MSGRYGDTGIVPSASLKEHLERQKKCFDFDGLKDGERKIILMPAFDLRNTEDKQYGQHGVAMTFAERRGDRVVSTEFFTGWSVDRHPTIMDGRDIGFMGVGLYNHYMKEADAPEGSYHHSDCPFTGGGCWGELGSSLYGDVILDRLVNEGSYGVWDEIDKEFKNE